MNTHNTQIDVLSDNVLSDKELDAATGGKKARVQVTKEQFDQINEVRKMFMELK